MLKFLKKLIKKDSKETKKTGTNEKNIQEVMKKTGWSHEYAVEQIKDARKRLSITYKDYNKYNMFEIPVEEQEKVYAKIKKEKRKNQKEENILSIMGKTGWSREHTVEQVEDAKKRIGITYKDYNKYDFHNIPVEEQENQFQEILHEKERRKTKSEKRKSERKKEKEDAILGIMKATGWDREQTELKVSEARERTGCTYKEYKIYKFYELSEEVQQEFFLINMSKKISKKYDVNREFVNMLSNKEKTNEFFSEYLGRPWCVNTKIAYEEFVEKFANSKRIIYKPLDGNRGRGVEAFEINRENAKEVFDKLVTYPDGVVEQYVIQHPSISSLAPSSVNTVRIVTISSNTNEVTSDGKKMDIAYAALRIGGGSSIVDNFHSGGMVAAIDLETGELVTDAADMEGNVFVNHPSTNVKIKGFIVPLFSEAVTLVEEAIQKNHIEGYLGWDIAITENGPILIEVNTVPGVVLLSMPYLEEKKGMKKVMEKYL